MRGGEGRVRIGPGFAALFAKDDDDVLKSKSSGVNGCAETIVDIGSHGTVSMNPKRSSDVSSNGNVSSNANVSSSNSKKCNSNCRSSNSGQEEVKGSVNSQTYGVNPNARQSTSVPFTSAASSSSSSSSSPFKPLPSSAPSPSPILPPSAVHWQGGDPIPVGEPALTSYAPLQWGL
eukprot:CAMPEP_0175047074 /NCGR_PEP_ID=MMETSP0052_2-20121109/5387_1 /TAXON_ID=51329 ORGANISM="Polytomella parva, Strain SAG 63-3" /NCGR_SAMPLE_ID=MMETSP0052_2 /ASSEMBLY_ACC=CAM_ASM_000194 /LENGTH=175 /DNA_ID=CAMNT_0016310897 /DNA_START=33 /DNA_END=557 /DNA_ORIENTATION=-